MLKIIKKYGRIINAFQGFMYHFIRYCRFSGWEEDFSNQKIRGYYVLKVYHALEKSMSYSRRNVESGWANAEKLIELIKVADKSQNIGWQDLAGLDVLEKFISRVDNDASPNKKPIIRELAKIKFKERAAEDNGVKIIKKIDIEEGGLIDPEKFFFSRFSLREFSEKTVDDVIVKRAIGLAMKSPSVCNRQAWHVYHTDDHDLIVKTLSHQDGNRGFGHKVPNLIIIAADLEAFIPGREHYQHWIDGGLFSMSLVYALHSLGIASCCLNWSQSPQNDLKLRGALNIRSCDKTVMMLAFGFPLEDNTVCVSRRRQIDEIYSKLVMR